MKDYRASLEKLRREAAEYRLISELATDKAKRDMFEKLALHLTGLADELERAMPGKPTSSA
jgi:molecular chaperone GrpE (heat shock protein)